MVIPAAPNQGDKVCVGILALPFRPLYNNMSLLSLLLVNDCHLNVSPVTILILIPPFLEGFPFQMFKNASHAPSFKVIVSSAEEIRESGNAFDTSPPCHRHPAQPNPTTFTTPIPQHPMSLCISVIVLC